ncbi:MULTISPECIES: DUF6284 family protein [Streptomyces]|uniref:Uncharacterized protein n=1 Tax=Streptomyces griseus subsp. griseus (strain JCM 4626 / CBS 651.72 / NBRC 13350 / KCC S-0626 / ISP 5235) TaxID=455632 RepID=B1VP38_STRGG|nr:DUF6284 family protein [Streptomyces griseus]MBW3706068.1 hypothetical protein [Streptomyces griseus]BAG20417.1 conserved hypothetical protein [Streptomyces griseus subsp. griseus NBRC 13350]SEE79797.1 hypothetical protein SAMN04490359_5933 [Streptomyces griseus]SQA23232.1 Uncharacterised protein [Streptomyces griseus]
MKHIGAVQAVVTADLSDREPTAAELDLIEQEMPVIRAEIELLDAQIIALDHTPNELDARRIRRASRKVLAARLAAANLTVMRIPGASA